MSQTPQTDSLQSGLVTTGTVGRMEEFAPAEVSGQLLLRLCESDVSMSAVNNFLRAYVSKNEILLIKKSR